MDHFAKAINKAAPNAVNVDIFAALKRRNVLEQAVHLGYEKVMMESLPTIEVVALLVNHLGLLHSTAEALPQDTVPLSTSEVEDMRVGGLVEAVEQEDDEEAL